MKQWKLVFRLTPAVLSGLCIFTLAAGSVGAQCANHCRNLLCVRVANPNPGFPCHEFNQPFCPPFLVYTRQAADGGRPCVNGEVQFPVYEADDCDPECPQANSEADCSVATEWRFLVIGILHVCDNNWT